LNWIVGQETEDKEEKGSNNPHSSRKVRKEKCPNEYPSSLSPLLWFLKDNREREMKDPGSLCQVYS